MQQLTAGEIQERGYPDLCQGDLIVTESEADQELPLYDRWPTEAEPPSETFESHEVSSKSRLSDLICASAHVLFLGRESKKGSADQLVGLVKRGRVASLQKQFHDAGVHVIRS